MALTMFNPSEDVSRSQRDNSEQPVEPKKAEEPNLNPNPIPISNSLKSETCEITHKDAISALSRATTKECKKLIEESYCQHKNDLLNSLDSSKVPLLENIFDAHVRTRLTIEESGWRTNKAITMWVRIQKF